MNKPVKFLRFYCRLKFTGGVDTCGTEASRSVRHRRTYTPGSEYRNLVAFVQGEYRLREMDSCAGTPRTAFASDTGLGVQRHSERWCSAHRLKRIPIECERGSSALPSVLHA